MKNLNEMANALELVKKSSKRNHVISVCNRLVEVLKDGKPKERQMVVFEITLLRLKEQNPELNLDEMNTKIGAGDKKMIELFTKTFKTIKNGTDTALANGQTNANFSYNPMFNTKYKIEKLDKKMIQLVKL